MIITLVCFALFVLWCKFDTDRKIIELSKKLDNYMDFDQLSSKINSTQLNVEKMNSQLNRAGGGMPRPPKPPKKK